MRNYYQTLDEYNGWKNRPTWDAYVWLRGEESLNMILQHILRTESNDNKAAYQLKTFIEKNNPIKNESGLYADLITFALEHVNFADIIVAFRKESYSQDQAR